MEYKEPTSMGEQIKDIQGFVDGDKLVLKWLWPNGIDSVYIYKSCEDEAVTIDMINNNNARLYTKEEYKEFYGYYERINEIEKITYWIFPCVKENGKLLLINQNGIDNRITLSLGKANIFYSIKEKRRLFKNTKIVKIIVRCDKAIGKEVLCYVIKSGASPINKDDGKRYSFNQDFNVGRNPLPEIEIKTDDSIRIFFQDGKKYGEIYELIRE
ncbi:MAG TPA: beta-mannanase [Clostridiaceae bacterium]|nr:beta-mannanase [Clostridiaceae bacterium]